MFDGGHVLTYGNTNKFGRDLDKCNASPECSRGLASNEWRRVLVMLAPNALDKRSEAQKVLRDLYPWDAL